VVSGGRLAGLEMLKGRRFPCGPELVLQKLLIFDRNGQIVVLLLTVLPVLTLLGGRFAAKFLILCPTRDRVRSRRRACGRASGLEKLVE
jgi:hypothetical protein